MHMDTDLKWTSLTSSRMQLFIFEILLYCTMYSYLVITFFSSNPILFVDLF